MVISLKLDDGGLSVEESIRNVEKDLKRVQREAIPAASAKALTFTAERAQKKVTGFLPQVFRNPTPFTRRAIRKQSATVRRAESAVLIKDLSVTRDHYLKVYTLGGARSQKRSEQRLGGYWVIGKDAKTNQYGNLTRGTYSKMLADVGGFGRTTGDAANTLTKAQGGKKGILFFMRRHKGTGLRIIYKKQGRGAVPYLVEINAPPRYRRRLPILKITKQVVDQQFGRLFSRAIERELKRRGL